jgi:S1-C subfamily serine protease
LPNGDTKVNRTANRSIRERLAPRTAIGMAAIVLSASIGAAFSGAILYSYYEYRIQKTNDRVNTLINTYQKEFQSAQGDLANQAAKAKAEIDKELGPALAASGSTLQNLDKKLAPSMFFVSTLDQSGQPSVGSAFAIASDSSQTLLIASYTTIAAATKKPGPPVSVRQGGTTTTVQVFNWDPTTDLALIILPKGNTPTVQPAPASPEPQIGDRVFSVAGIGSLGAQAAQGTVTDVSAAGIQHTSPVGNAFQGGPIVNVDGLVVAVASRGYAPLNFTSDSVWFAPLVRAACNRVLSCPNGTLSSPGAHS